MQAMLDPWMLAQPVAFGVFLLFSSYLVYRQRIKRIRKIQRSRAVLV